jgi:hypothetical protein
VASPNINPSVNFFAIFCSGCGEILDSTHAESCDSPHGTFCTQCGKVKHDYVCYPDARLLEKHGLKADQVAPSIKRVPLKPLWT